jgi:hypothetical protein
MQELRNLVVTIMDNRRTHTSAGAFPETCPNCHYTWTVDEQWMDNRGFQTGGRQAICPNCGCLMFEVIDRERHDRI